jgi:hypothetical protein
MSRAFTSQKNATFLIMLTNVLNSLRWEREYVRVGQPPTGTDRKEEEREWRMSRLEIIDSRLRLRGMRNVQYI